MKTNRKIITDRNFMNDNEILKNRKGFDSLKEEYFRKKKSSTVKFQKTAWIMGIAAGFALVVIIYFFYNTRQKNVIAINIKMIADTSFFIKPLPEFIVYQKFVVDTKKDVELISKKGSRIHIKANTFIDKNGKTVDGNVEVIYNEYHNPVELFLSGIPMKYDTAGFNYTFESAGMFEIYAKKDNEFLAMNESNPISIDLVSNQNEAFNLYFYDTKENKWSFLNNDRLSDIKEKDDNTLADNQKDDFTIMPKEERSVALESQPKEEMMFRKANPDNYSFSIDYKEDEFPELTKYKDLLFEIDKSDTSFLDEYYDVKWTKISLSKSDKEAYIVELSRFNKTVKFQAYPVLDASGYEKAIKAYSKNEAEISKEKELNMKNIAVLAENKKDADAQNQMLNNFQYYRNLSIINLGAYNFDRPIPLPESPLQISFNFSDKAGNVLNYSEINIIQGNRNILWKYSRNKSSYISKSLNNVIWFLTPVNQMAILEIKGNKVTSINPSQTVELLTVKEGIEKLKSLLDNV